MRTILARSRVINLVSRWAPPAIFDALVAAFRGLPVDRPYRFADYQGVRTAFDAQPLHAGRFAESYERHWRLDPHFTWDVMRYRCYNVATLAMQCRDVAGDFVFAGISYGVSARVLYDFVEFEKLGKIFHLIDPFTAFNPNDRRGRSDFYNTDPAYVRAQYPADAPVKICRDIIPDALNGIGSVAFAALNTTNAPAETISLPILFEKLAAGGIIIIDTYGTIGGCFAEFDPVFAGLGVTPLWFPSGQCAVIKR
jgi:hypothetical protein